MHESRGEEKVEDNDKARNGIEIKPKLLTTKYVRSREENDCISTYVS